MDRKEYLTRVTDAYASLGPSQEATEPLLSEAPPEESTPDTEVPDESWTKAEISEWLVASGQEVPAGATKAELLELVE